MIVTLADLDDTRTALYLTTWDSPDVPDGDSMTLRLNIGDRKVQFADAIRLAKLTTSAIAIRDLQLFDLLQLQEAGLELVDDIPEGVRYSLQMATSGSR